MTSTFTKDQVQKLPPDQQEAIARLTIQQLQCRQQLLERARRYRGMNVLGGLLMGLAFGLSILSTAIPRLLPLAIIVAAGLAGFHAAGINRRLDVLIELMETDGKRASDPEIRDVVWTEP